VNFNGFDTHFNLKDTLNSKFTEIGAVLKGFRDALVAAGLWDKVTVVVSSEMGRTISPNTSSGTDHGWGGHSFIMGGDVRVCDCDPPLFRLSSYPHTLFLCS
jgi:uncharacterized protein (DUF1501 family)